MQSCLNDSESWPEGTNLAIATVRIKETTEQHNFYFLLDNNKTINPVTLKHKDYKAIDGQRAFVYFGMIDNKSVISDENYDYNANIFYIENILTKDIIPLSEVDKDSIGNDLLDITKVWIAQGYLNVECRYYSLNSDNKHLLNMVYHEVDDEGYICLEFKHNAFHDYGTYARNGRSPTNHHSVAVLPTNQRSLAVLPTTQRTIAVLPTNQRIVAVIPVHQT